MTAWDEDRELDALVAKFGHTRETLDAIVDIQLARIHGEDDEE